MIASVRWAGDAVRIVDQTRLPEEVRELDLRTLDEVAEAIRSLRVRGAPLIGITAAMGLAASLRRYVDEDPKRFRARLEEHAAALRRTRPTAVNLGWALDRMRRAAGSYPESSSAELGSLLRAEADAILEEDRRLCERMGEAGLELLPDPAVVLTHCNTGVLATGGIGTALAPIYRAARSGRRVRVIVPETRPLLQGSRLTAWELSQAGIEATVIADNAAAAAMKRLDVDLVIVGADRVTARGDVANKIGTYGLAVAARHHGLPFYVAAPYSSFDFSIRSGDEVPIEERSPDEIRLGFGRRTAPEEVPVFSPAFDVTPAELVTAFVTDRGVLRPPYEESLRALRRSPAAARAGS